MLVLLLGFFSLSTPGLSEALAQEIGRTVAHATLLMGQPDGFSDMVDGQRAYHWHKAPWAGGSGPACSSTAYAVLDGEPQALAAWNVVAIEPSAPGC